MATAQWLGLTIVASIIGIALNQLWSAIRPKVVQFIHHML